MEKVDKLEVCKILGGTFRNGECIIPEDELPFANKQYELDGLVTVTDWYGNTGWVKLHITTDEKGFEEIKREPLQDYIQFGVQSVDYAEFEPREKITITKSKSLPVIKAGKYNLTEKEEEAMFEDFNVVEITY